MGDKKKRDGSKSRPSTPTLSSTNPNTQPGTSKKPPLPRPSKKSIKAGKSRKSYIPIPTSGNKRTKPVASNETANNTSYDVLNKRLLDMRLKTEEEILKHRRAQAKKRRTLAEHDEEIRAKAIKSLAPLKSQPLPPPLPASESIKQFDIFFQSKPTPLDPDKSIKPLKLFKSTPPQALTSSLEENASNPLETKSNPVLSDNIIQLGTRRQSTMFTMPETLQQKLEKVPAASKTKPQNQKEIGKRAPGEGAENNPNILQEKPGRTSIKNGQAWSRRTWSGEGDYSPSEDALNMDLHPPMDLIQLLESSKDDTQADVWYYHTHPIAIERGPHVQNTKLRGGGSHNNLKSDESLLDLLRTVKDEQPQITIIPADESKVVDIELEEWTKHRRMFLILLGITFLMGLIIFVLTLVSSCMTYIFNTQVKKHSPQAVGFLMHTDVSIITSTSLSGFGILIFRMFPEAKKHILIRLHIIIFIVIYMIFVWAYVIAFTLHEAVTGRPEHLYTLHGMVGLIIAVLLVWEAGSGIYIIFKPKSKLVLYHRSPGMITFMLGGAVSVSGYAGRALIFTGPIFAITPVKTVMSNITAVLIIIFCCLVRYIATEFRFRRRSCPEWDTVFGRTYHPDEYSNIDIPGQTLQKYVRMNIREEKKRYKVQ